MSLLCYCSPKEIKRATFFTVNMIPDNQRRQEVITHFQQVRQETWYSTTNGGFFAPTPIELLDPVLSNLFARGVLKKEQTYLDPGCGDGRVVALLAAYGVGVVGIEIDPNLAEQSQRNIDDLFSSLSDDKPRIIQGDSTDDKTYITNGIEFDDMDCIICYLQLTTRMAEKMRLSYSYGKRLLTFRELPRDSGLRLIERIKMPHAPSILVSSSFFVYGTETTSELTMPHPRGFQP